MRIIQSNVPHWYVLLPPSIQKLCTTIKNLWVIITSTLKKCEICVVGNIKHNIVTNNMEYHMLEYIDIVAVDIDSQKQVSCCGKKQEAKNQYVSTKM